MTLKIHIFNNKISPYIHQIELCEPGLQSNTFTNKWEKRLTESFQKKLTWYSCYLDSKKMNILTTFFFKFNILKFLS